MLRLSFLSLLALLVATPALAANNEVVSPLKRVVGSVRYGRDKAALKYFDGEAQGKLLLGPSWDKATAAQRTEFVELFETLFAKMAFPKVRANFEHLESILYDEPKVDGDKATAQFRQYYASGALKTTTRKTLRMQREKGQWRITHEGTGS